ncbi:MAG: 2,4'-dihydroxyacetophenone dioxygenase family protein [Actinomycetes bacterium]
MDLFQPTTHAIHVGADDLPFVDAPSGEKLKVLHALEKEGMWIVETIFPAGYEVQTHRHTGAVWAYTVSGAWQYKEYDFVNRAGSFLYEPANSVHTLMAVEDDTRVWFQIFGANLNLDEHGNVASITDARSALLGYYWMCEQAGLPRPNVITDIEI